MEQLDNTEYGQYLIHIKDIINNKEYIYNTEYNLESGFLKCVESIKRESIRKDNLKEDNILYKIYDNHCEIYYYDEIKKRGWIWNYKSLEKNIIYILTYIPLYIKDIKNKPTLPTSVGDGRGITNVDIETQTEPEKETRIINQSKYKKLESDSDNDSEINYNLGIGILDELKIPLLDTINWCYSELEPVIENFSSLNLGNGYANTPFFPKDLERELKNQLSKPNYGLKSLKNN